LAAGTRPYAPKRTSGGHLCTRRAAAAYPSACSRARRIRQNRAASAVTSTNIGSNKALDGSATAGVGGMFQGRRASGDTNKLGCEIGLSDAVINSRTINKRRLAALVSRRARPIEGDRTFNHLAKNVELIRAVWRNLDRVHVGVGLLHRRFTGLPGAAGVPALIVNAPLSASEAT
jgi:hypothetical protein